MGFDDTRALFRALDPLNDDAIDYKAFARSVGIEVKGKSAEGKRDESEERPRPLRIREDSLESVEEEVAPLKKPVSAKAAGGVSEAILARMRPKFEEAIADRRFGSVEEVFAAVDKGDSGSITRKQFESCLSSVKVCPVVVGRLLLGLMLLSGGLSRVCSSRFGWDSTTSALCIERWILSTTTPSITRRSRGVWGWTRRKRRRRWSPSEGRMVMRDPPAPHAFVKIRWRVWKRRRL